MPDFNPDTTRPRFTVVRSGMNREDLVAEFHRAMDLPVDVPPQRWSASLLKLRIKLLHEEFHEMMEELETLEALHFTLTDGPTRNMVERLLKEMADLQYVLSGTAVSLGLDLEAAFTRVHESNLSKLDDRGHPIKDPSTGKVLKGPNYQPPNLKDLVP